MSDKYRTPTYISWEGMRYRCQVKTNPSYHRYGGRGIKVCDKWQIFSNFLEDMGEKPENHSLDRINNDGDYTPENCRWSISEVQQNNRSNNNLQNFQGKCLSISQWARELNLPRGSIVTRMFSYDESFEDAVRHVTNSRKYLND